jgi:acetolactate synthase-1/2/3 large subunit
MRGADLLVKTLVTAGVRRLFTLSGNQIMAVFDACIDTDIKLIHVRHEAAAVHMADAWGRLTGTAGVALVTAGPGFANTLSALYVATMAESPLLVLSGHAPLSQLGRGAFQDMAQAEMAAPVTKASWTVSEAAQLGDDIVRAYRLAHSGRPGPVHVSLPVDVLEAQVEPATFQLPPDDHLRSETTPWQAEEVAYVLDTLAKTQKPLILAGPALARGEGAALSAALAASIRVPVIGMESPRGINDPSLGAFAEVLGQADMLVLLGKRLDFMVQGGKPPAVSPACRFIHIDPEPQALNHTRHLLDVPSRLVTAMHSDALVVAQQMVQQAGGRHVASAAWYDEVQAALTYRPSAWGTMRSAPGDPLHAVEVCRAVQDFLSQDEDAIYISDGGEFGQWAQACLATRHRLINGPSGAIGSAIPFALAAREAFPTVRIVTMLGDGTCGFHAAEFDTATRYRLPFIAVVGNDATWNAEYQIQLRNYGPGRLIGCELLPTPYDNVVQALGGHGESVSLLSELAPALDRAYTAGVPACINVSLARHAAPMIRRRAS